MHHLIVGAGAAAVAAAETLRKNSPSDQITMVSAEKADPYSRMAIPYILTGKITESGAHLRQRPNYYAELRIDVLHDSVVSISPEAHQATLASGPTISYDRCLIATGSIPIKPDIEGVDSNLVHNCWTLKDAESVARYATEGMPVVLMGAGFIGSIILEALALRGVDLTVVEHQSRMVPRMMGEQAGGLLKAWCEEKGVQVLTSTDIVRIEQRSESRLNIYLSGGEVLDAALLIAAAGVRSNTDFLTPGQFEVDQGILVDCYMRTNHQDVYAAGDVAQALDFSTGKRLVQAIQPTAVEHGHIAALNMLDTGTGEVVRHRGSLVMNVLDTLGLLSCSIGVWQGVDGGETVERFDPDRYRYICLQFEGDRLIGATLVGHRDHQGALRGLIEGSYALGRHKDQLLKDPTRIMEVYLAVAQSNNALGC